MNNELQDKLIFAEIA